MRRVRMGWLFACLLGACCAVPPRVDDRSTPEMAYETFRGALARAEHAREWECLSDPLRSRLGMGSRIDWKEARAVVLHDGHLLVRGVRCSRLAGTPERLEDGRVLLALRFPLGHKGRVWMRPVVALRGYVEDDPEPQVFAVLRDLDVALDPDGNRISIAVPDEEMFWLAKGWDPTRRFVRIEAGVEWLLDDFAAGEESPDSVRADLNERDQRP